MAEGGDISGLETLGSNIGAYSVSNPAEGLLAPGQTTTTKIKRDRRGYGNTSLSVVGMIFLFRSPP